MSLKLKRWILIFLGLTTLAGVVIYLDLSENTIDIEPDESIVIPPTVSVKRVKVSSEKIEIEAYGEIKPRWHIELRSAVNGKITRVYDSALSGEKVNTGSILIDIENNQYIAETMQAKLAVKEAELGMSKAEKATSVARRMYLQDKLNPPNDLALHLPQLEIAKTALKAAKAHLKAAEVRLQNTTVKAPFSGYISERFVSPGQSVNNGDILLKLVDDSTFELSIDLSRNDWLLLKQPVAGLNAALFAHSGESLASATIRRGGGFLDQNTRLYKLFLEIKSPANKKILSGDFVRILLPGITLPRGLKVPESALTKTGYLWYLDNQDRLKRLIPEVISHSQGYTIVRAPKGKVSWRIVIYPQASLLSGQKVSPKIVEQ